jgi:catechol 2,3-dioxygenase-like lactoylglutathione lyase family enzyme
MELVGIVVDDLAAATAFFVELGLKPVEGGWVDRVVGLEGVRAELAMVEPRARSRHGERTAPTASSPIAPTTRPRSTA